ncbi:hypothetical protein [Rudaeicoccus suwonensis]|uniref:DUF8175 domain-containing protein n=1 Tax=Rudaeicoccus suwonensis TaxID=657409 RepID=A0A561DVK0_9MICO|nr:hypothetical protein [Rudaeicoccus suwonensis]TWE07370.1 hypothetical protein BKA23_3383 [Rudaeicoccus suwonensis]
MEHDNDQPGISSRWVALGGGVLAIAIIGGGWVALTGNGSSTKTSAPTTTVTVAPGSSSPGAGTSTGTASSASTPAARTGCGFPAAWDATPASSAPQVTWQQVGGLSAPTSPQLGPGKVSGPDGAIRQCYQHSPTGAVMAAANIAIGASDPLAGNEVVEKQFTPGPGKQQVLDQQGEEGTATIAGFQVEACEPAKCLISIAVSGGGNYGAATVPLVWSGGDWMVDGTVTGISAGQPLSSLAGYVPFSPGLAS